MNPKGKLQKCKLKNKHEKSKNTIMEENKGKERQTLHGAQIMKNLKSRMRDEDKRYLKTVSLVWSHNSLFIVKPQDGKLMPTKNHTEYHQLLYTVTSQTIKI